MHRLPPISNEITFEEFVCDALQSDQRFDSLNRLGRKGQKQFGIDILGTLSESGQMVAIQCKCTNPNRIPKIKVIREELERADREGLKLSYYIWAHTGSKCARLEADLVTLSQERQQQGKSSVLILAWDDLTRIAVSHQTLLQRYFPDFVLTIFPERQRRITYWRSSQIPLTLLGRPISAKTFSIISIALLVIGAMVWLHLISRLNQTPGIKGLLLALGGGALMTAGGIMQMMVFTLTQSSKKLRFINKNEAWETDASGYLWRVRISGMCWCGTPAEIEIFDQDQGTKQPLMVCTRNPVHPGHRALFDFTDLPDLPIQPTNIPCAPSPEVSAQHLCSAAK